jgi:hypothetical protein
MSASAGAETAHLNQKEKIRRSYEVLDFKIPEKIQQL